MSRWFDGHTPDDETTITRAEWKRAQTPAGAPHITAPSNSPHPEDEEQQATNEGAPAGSPFNPETMGFNPYWKRPRAEVPALPDPLIPWRRYCELCGDSAWVRIPDPFFDGATTDQRCPVCQDTTVRARRNVYEQNNGQRVGPDGPIQIHGRARP